MQSTRTRVPSCVSFLKNFKDFLSLGDGGVVAWRLRSAHWRRRGFIYATRTLISAAMRLHIWSDKVVYEIESAKDLKKNRPPHTGALQSACRRVLERHAALSQRQPEHRGAVAATSRAKPPFTILDFGCGPGRDLKAFVEQGHNAIGLQKAVPSISLPHGACP